MIQKKLYYFVAEVFEKGVLTKKMWKIIDFHPLVFARDYQKGIVIVTFWREISDPDEIKFLRDEGFVE